MLKNNFELEENTFFWTDVEFGGNDEKHPLLLVGQETGKLLQKEKFTGFDTGEIWE